MPYDEFKKRIDTARNILVGAVPSPAGQIDQITYALMYKFMNDIDDQSAALGGKRTYFTGDYEKYNWHNLMSPSLGAHERLELYRQAVQGMAKNENLPPLFREIYQNAFLPFNSSHVLTLFLKEIDKFVHGESDDIGDAYEYLLSITGSQGDVGQFRTPRHIIKFIVEAVNPTKDDKVLDPAVGTAGFLIAAYNHVKKAHDGKDENGNKNNEKYLSADELNKLHKNYRGFDIDPTMVRTASVNMYLHGFSTPDIINHDSLSSEDYWNDKYDVILANPPFMTPKGGIQPHKKFAVTANRAEVLFVDYIASHLRPTGRAGVVVPEGIIFQSGKAYKQLRKNLVENGLWCVISLPAGVFQPYSGVKTSVLLLDRNIAKKFNRVMFINITTDGFNSSVKRRPTIQNDLPHALDLIKYCKKEIDSGNIRDDYAFPFEDRDLKISTIQLNYSFEKVSRLKDDEDISLQSSRYILEKTNKCTKWQMVCLTDILDYEQPTKYIVESTDYSNNFKTPVLTAGKSFILGYTDETHGIYNADKQPVIIFDDFTTATKFVNFQFKVKSSAMKILSAKNNANISYVFYMMQKIHFNPVEHKRFWISEYSKLKIPLPPIEIQCEIVAELDGYQKIIDAAQTIIESYKPTIKINPKSKLSKLIDLTDVRDGTHDSPKYVNDKGYPLITSKNLRNGNLDFTDVNLISKGDFDNINKRSKVDDGDILIPMIGTIGGAVRIQKKREFAIKNVALIKQKSDTVDMAYICHLMNSDFINNKLLSAATGGTQKFISLGFIRNLEIPLPPIEIQREIVAKLEAEQKLIDANKKLIEIYQQKIKDKLAEIWGE